MAKEKPGEVALDFSGVKPFEPLDPGIAYLCRVTNLTLGTSKEGNPKTSLELTIEAPDEVQVEEWVGESGSRKSTGGVLEATTKAAKRKLFREFSLLPDALPYLYEFIKAADPAAELNEKFVYKPANYMGLQVAVKVQNEEYAEQIRPRVHRVLPASAHSG